MNASTIADTQTEDFPSLDLVYAIAIASYDTMAKRHESIDGRLQTLTAFAVTACLAVPALGKAQNLSFRSFWFWLAMSLLFSATSINVYARLSGHVRLLNISNLWKDSLHLPQATFKRYAIFYAAKSFEQSDALLNRKWLLGIIAMIVYAVALMSLILWVAQGNQT